MPIANRRDDWIPPWETLRQLMTKARRENLVFYQPFQQLTFTPDELQMQWNKGSFRWGAVNWELIEGREGANSSCFQK